MKIKKIFLYFFCLFFSCSLFPQEKELEVELTTANSLLFIYLSPFFHEKSEFSEAYLESLHEVLHFDLHTNGYFHVIRSERKKDVFLEKKKRRSFFFRFLEEREYCLYNKS